MRGVGIIGRIMVCAALSAAPASAQEAIRLAIGGGYGVGSNSGTYKVAHGTLDLQSITGGSGPVLTAQAWVDHVLLSEISARIEFLRLMNTATASLDLPHGASILTDPITGGAKLSATANMGFLDAAFRPQLVDPSLGFYVGLGAGGGVGKAGASYSLYNPALGAFGQRSSVHAPIGGVHGFVGAEYYFTKSLFISVEPQVLYVTGHVVGIHQSYVDMIVSGTLGYSF